DGAWSHTPGWVACCSYFQSPVMATHSMAGWATRPFAAATSDHVTSTESPSAVARDAGWRTRAYAANVTGSSDPTSYSKLRTPATIQSAVLTSSTITAPSDWLAIAFPSGPAANAAASLITTYICRPKCLPLRGWTCRHPRRASARRKPILGSAIVRGVNHLVVDVPGRVALGWPARPD